MKKIAHICLNEQLEIEKAIKVIDPQLLEKSSNILVAEDNDVNQKIIKIILEKIGFNVIIAKNGLEAYELFQKKPIDFIFMDCQMPEMDGFESCQKIRSLKNGKDVPIVALTGNVTKEDRKACFDAQMNDFVKKPFSEADLIDVLNKWLQNKHPLEDKETETDTESEVIKDSDKLLSPSSPIEIDIGRFEQVMALGTDDHFATSIIDKFNSTTKEQISIIKKELEQNNYSEVQSICHRLKSSCASLGAHSMFELCAQIESQIKEGKLNDIEFLCQKLETSFTSTADQFNELRRRYESE